MSIIAVKSDTVLKEGDWVVCAHSMFLGRVSVPVQVVRQAGLRVYLKRTRKLLKGETEPEVEEVRKHLKSVLYLCSTEAEAQALFDFNHGHHNETHKLVSKLQYDRAKDYTSALTKLIKSFKD